MARSLLVVVVVVGPVDDAGRVPGALAARCPAAAAAWEGRWRALRAAFKTSSAAVTAGGSVCAEEEDEVAREGGREGGEKVERKDGGA